VELKWKCSGTVIKKIMRVHYSYSILTCCKYMFAAAAAIVWLTYISFPPVCSSFRINLYKLNLYRQFEVVSAV
jgi:hypothetical protein